MFYILIQLTGSGESIDVDEDNLDTNVDNMDKPKMNEGGSPIYIDSGSDEDPKKSTNSSMSTTTSSTETGSSTEHDKAKNSTAETVDGNKKDATASGSNTKADDSSRAGTDAGPSTAGQPTVVMNVTNVTINISANSSGLGNIYLLLP